MRVLADQQEIGGLCDRDDQRFTDAVDWLAAGVFTAGARTIISLTQSAATGLGVANSLSRCFSPPPPIWNRLNQLN